MRTVFIVLLSFFANNVCFCQTPINIDTLSFSIKVTKKKSVLRSFDLLLQTEKIFPNKNNMINSNFWKHGNDIGIAIYSIAIPEIRVYAIGPASQYFDLGVMKNGKYDILLTKGMEKSRCILIIRRNYYKLIVLERAFLANEPCMKSIIPK